VTERSGVTLGTGTGSGRSTPEERRALFRVVRGAPDDAEVAALTVVLAAVAASAKPTDERPVNRWVDPVARLRTPLAVGPGAWQTTYWPR
jgi:acyl-CoA carboxylase epsilon subunit